MPGGRRARGISSEPVTLPKPLLRSEVRDGGVRAPGPNPRKQGGHAVQCAEVERDKGQHRRA